MNRYVKEIVVTNPRPFEFILSMQSIVLGLWFFLPGNTFDILGVPSVFTVMRQIAPGQVWGAAVFILGVVRFFGMWTEHIHLRRAIAVIGLFTWLAIDLSMWATGVLGLLPFAFILSIIASSIVNLNLILWNGAKAERSD